MLEGLAASGLRAIRYALEIPQIESVVANDISMKAYQCIHRHVQQNGVQDKVFPSQRDASLLMYEHRPFTKRFDVVDIDPYGSPSQFLDSTVQCIEDGGERSWSTCHGILYNVLHMPGTVSGGRYTVRTGLSRSHDNNLISIVVIIYSL